MMKNKLFTALTVIFVVLLISSCATSRKYGCPSVSKVEVQKKNFHS